MKLRLAMIVFAIAGYSTCVNAKDITQVVKVSIQKSELSITRLRLYLGPKINQLACKSYGNILRSGGTVHVKITGAGDELITTFHVTKDKCKK